MAGRPGIFSKEGFDALMKQVQYGYDNIGPKSSGWGAAMGMLGIPFDVNGRTVNPRTQTTYMVGTTNPAAARLAPPPPTTPDTPADAAAKRRAEMIKSGLTPEYVDWLMSSGQYGGVPPAGLLG